MIIIICGPSAAGKTTLANKMVSECVGSTLVDSDEVHHLLPKVDFSLEGRLVHVKNITKLLRTFYESNPIVFATFCLPILEMREIIRQELKDLPVLFWWLDTPIEVCIERDPKGLYRKQTPNMPGVDFPLERPEPNEQATIVI